MLRKINRHSRNFVFDSGSIMILSPSKTNLSIITNLAVAIARHNKLQRIIIIASNYSKNHSKGNVS